MQAQQLLDAASAELSTERWRSGAKDEHYRRQDDDASQLAVQNRLLLEDVRELSGRSKQAEAENAGLKKAHVELQTKVYALTQRADLARALRGLPMADMRALISSSTAVASSIQHLTEHIHSAP